LPRIWLADEWAHPGKIDFADASAIVVGLMAAWETSPPRPGHKFTRANEFSGLSALCATLCASRPSFALQGARASFRPAKRNVRARGLKPLESLETANESFRGFVSYQWLEPDFVSVLSAHGAHRPWDLLRALVIPFRIGQALQLWRTCRFFRETTSIADVP
jgi:hypothetical protein